MYNYTHNILDGLQAELATATATIDEKNEKITNLESDLKTLVRMTTC